MEGRNSEKNIKDFVNLYEMVRSLLFVQSCWEAWTTDLRSLDLCQPKEGKFKDNYAQVRQQQQQKQKTNLNEIDNLSSVTKSRICVKETLSVKEKY